VTSAKNKGNVTFAELKLGDLVEVTEWSQDDSGQSSERKIGTFKVLNDYPQVGDDSNRPENKIFIEVHDERLIVTFFFKGGGLYSCGVPIKDQPFLFDKVMP